MSNNVETVEGIQRAIERGDLMEVMGHVSRDVRWAVNASDTDAAPWFGEYRGRRGVLSFFEALSQVRMKHFDVKQVSGRGDVVSALLHIAFVTPTGAEVEMDEVQIWQFRDGIVESVDLFPDAEQIAAAYC